MDADPVATLRTLMAGSGGWSRPFAGPGMSDISIAGGLLWWHPLDTPAMAHGPAHLDDEARLSGIAELTPTLVRWSPPAGAPPASPSGLPT